jgi:type VI secretion system protein ImpM
MMPDTSQTTIANAGPVTGRPLDVGFYGKLPSHGDFLRRRVSDAFVGVWDGWLQECIASSRLALGDRWLDVYLTSPAWRFICAAGTCGAAPVIGLMVPSVDRVGRYFPLTLVAELPQAANLIAASAESEAFFEGAERLVIETLEAEHIDFERFDERLLKLGYQLGSISGPPQVVLDAAGVAVLDDGQACWQIPIGSPPQLAPTFAQLLSFKLAAMYDPLVIWWTEGSAIVQPSCLITKGLPHPDMYAALLDGAWERRQWRSASAHVDLGGLREETLVDDPTPPRFRSAAASDVGRVREINEDSFLERPDVGLWVVADGLGGHSDGEVASRMVCDALADFVPDGGFEDMLDEARARIDDVNEHLLRAATRAVNPVRSGSTVVALLVRGSRCAVLWAGDSRVYRLRDGQLEQVTRDHSLAESEGLIGGPASHAITRAVGGEATLSLDLYRNRVRPGDRFLLCSDGLTRAVPEPVIRTWMEHADIRAAADGMVKATLDAGAPDNVTVLIVEAVP